MALGRQILMGLANFIDPTRFIRNKFNETFYWGLGSGYTSYDTKGETYIREGYQSNPIVYSVINQQATKTASIPFAVKKIEDAGEKGRLDALELVTGGNYSPQQMVKKLLLENKAFSESDLKFPLERPNPNQTWTEIWALYKTFLKATGNVYFYLLAPEGGQNVGQPIQLYVLPSQYVQIIIREDAGFLEMENPISGYILVQGSGFLEFDVQNVIHVKYPNPDYDMSGSQLYGQSPLRAALKNMESSNSALELNIKTLKSGGAFGFIHAKNTPLTENQAAEIKSRLKEMNSSPEDLSKIAGISSELAFTRLSLTSDELRPFDYLKYDQKQICNVLNWSDKLLNNDDGAKYDNVAEFRRQVVTDNITPDLKLLTDAFNREFLPRFKGYENTVLVFDVMELPEMQIDIVENSKWVYEGIDKGVLTRNEGRTTLRYRPLDDPNMDIITVQDEVLSLEESLDQQFNITE